MANQPEQRGEAAASLCEHYREVRGFTERLCDPLATEDYVVQSMPDVSPAKWHLAHVTWFFEQFILRPHCPGYRDFHPRYAYLFNSYYQSVGERHARPERGLLTRPTIAEIYEYRTHVDEALLRWLPTVAARPSDDIAFLVELGLNHEQQHQELLLMDIKHVFSVNPLLPTYREATAKPTGETPTLSWQRYEEGIYRFGRQPGGAFCYDNETPRHKMLAGAFELGTRLVTNAEWAAFVEDGGYRTPTLWLADGWDWVQASDVRSPLYWRETADGWQEFTLHGLQPLDPARPVSHISFYEADAYATWAGARLPTEYEWELAASETAEQTDGFSLAPRPAAAGGGLQQCYGELWQWTRSAYQPYPGFRPLTGTLGEYNGKFMANQMVMRGGACITPPGHTRSTYRNFFYPHMRWQFAGLRLARDV